MEDSDKVKIDLLVKQSENLGSEITSFMILSARVIGIGSGIVFAVLALALKEKIHDVILALPVAMFALFFYFINLHTSILEMGGYNKRIEEEINRMVGYPVCLWEIGLVSRRHTNLANVFLAVIFNLILLLCLAVSLYVSYKHHPLWVLYCNVSTMAIFTLGLIISIKRMRGAHHRTYMDACRLCASDSMVRAISTANKANARAKVNPKPWE